MSRRSFLKQKILQHLLLHGSATRPELIAMCGVRAATVLEAIDELKAERIIEEPERRSKKTGRRAPVLSCASDCCHAVGVELRVSGCAGVIINASGIVMHQVDHPAERRRTVNDVKREILSVLQHLRDLAGDEWYLVRGIGFADPGLVDTDHGCSVLAVNIPGWRNVKTVQMLEDAAGLPAKIWPGTMIKTRMEYLSRLSDAPESIFTLVTGDGVGGGFIKNGELFTSRAGRPMEIGHIVVEPDGLPCGCGNRGCLEASASMEWLSGRIAKAREDGIDLGGFPEKFSMAAFIEFLGKNRGIQMIADELIRNICSALGVAVMLLNPDVIVISGSLAGMGEYLTGALREELEKRCFAEAVKELDIEISRLEAFDTPRGAAIMMRDWILSEGR